MPHFGKRSIEQRATLHPKLQAIVDFVIQVFDISIICGHRGEPEQDKAFDEARSKVRWPNSKHNKQPSRAVDAWPYPVIWPSLDGVPEEHRKAAKDYANALSSWYYMAGIFKGVAMILGIKIRWGGHFKSLFDAPHFELDDDEQ